MVHSTQAAKLAFTDLSYDTTPQLSDSKPVAFQMGEIKGFCFISRRFARDSVILLISHFFLQFQRYYSRHSVCKEHACKRGSGSQVLRKQLKSSALLFTVDLQRIVNVQQELIKLIADDEELQLVFRRICESADGRSPLLCGPFSTMTRLKLQCEQKLWEATCRGSFETSRCRLENTVLLSSDLKRKTQPARMRNNNRITRVRVQI